MPRRWSDVTPAWMTVAIARRHPGVAVREVRIGDVEHGTNSRARVALVLDGGDGPRSVFVKGPGRRAHRLALRVLGALETEARLADAGVRLPLEHPAFYAGGVDRFRWACVVVSDDVFESGGRPHDALTPLSVDAVGTGLGGLAALHASFWNRPLPVSLGRLREWRLGPVLSAVSVLSLARGMRRARETGVEVDAVLARADGARALGYQFRRSAAIAASGAQTVLHGDPHPGNTYSTSDGRTGFLDWQLARRGHWSHDVGYFLVGSLDVEDRRRHERDLLAQYLDALVHAGAADAPCMTVAWERYRGTPAFGLATWLHTLSFGTLQRADVCAATIRRFAAAYADLGTARSDVAG